MIFKTYDVVYLDNQGNQRHTQATANSAAHAVNTVAELLFNECARVIKVTPQGEW